MQSINELKVLLSNTSYHSCPNNINLHSHTLCSDGSLHPIELIQQASNKKLKHLSITDHHTTNAYDDIYKWIDNNSSNFTHIPTIWTGIEISCLLKRCLVHVIGLGFDRYNYNIRPYSYGDAVKGDLLEAASVVKAIHLSGGIAILAHPARYRLPFNILIDEAHKLGFDGAEAWYDYEMKPKWSPSTFVCESIDKHLRSLSMLRSCGTDTHGHSLDGR